jgi:hypothetical protein
VTTRGSAASVVLLGLIALAASAAAQPAQSLAKVDRLALGGVHVAGERACRIEGRQVAAAIEAGLGRAAIPFLTGPAWAAEDDAYRDSHNGRPYDELYTPQWARLHAMPRLRAVGTLIPAADGCAYDVAVELVAPLGPAAFAYTGAPFDGHVAMWRRAATGFAHPADVAGKVAAAIDRMVREFAIERAADLAGAARP